MGNSNQKGFANIVLVVVIIILAGAAGYFTLVKKSGPQICTEDAKVCPDGTIVGRMPPNCEFTACPTVTPTPKGETVNWKTYRNEEYGFEVKYPGEFPIRTQTDAAVLFHLEINPAPPLEADMGGPPRYLWIQVDNKEPPVDCLRVWSQEGTSGGIVTISGVSATRCLIPGSFFGEGVELWIQVNRGEFSYYFISDFYDRNKETIDQILPTFKFIK